MTARRTWKHRFFDALPAGLIFYLFFLVVGVAVFHLAGRAQKAAARRSESLSRSLAYERRLRLAAQSEARINAEIATRERAARIAAENRAQTQTQLADRERFARLAAERRAQEEADGRSSAEVAALRWQRELNDGQLLRFWNPDNAIEESTPVALETWQVARIINRTLIPIYFQIRKPSGNWHEEELAPNWWRIYWQRGEAIEVKFDSSTRPGYQPRDYELETKTSTGGPPTADDKQRAPETSFEIVGYDRNGYSLIDMLYSR